MGVRENDVGEYLTRNNGAGIAQNCCPSNVSARRRRRHRTAGSGRTSLYHGLAVQLVSSDWQGPDQCHDEDGLSNKDGGDQAELCGRILTNNRNDVV